MLEYQSIFKDYNRHLLKGILRCSNFVSNDIILVKYLKIEVIDMYN